MTRQHLRVMQQLDRIASTEDADAREQAMAENVGWILRTHPGARVFVWAHNAHVQVSRTVSRTYGTAMGFYLRRNFGASFVAIGFVFDHGSFQAIDRSGVSGLREVTLQPPFGPHWSSVFAKIGNAPLFLDFRRAPDRGDVAEWLRTPRYVRETGQTFASASAMLRLSLLVEEFDAVLFVPRTTRATFVRSEAPE